MSSSDDRGRRGEALHDKTPQSLLDNLFVDAWWSARCKLGQPLGHPETDTEGSESSGTQLDQCKPVLGHQVQHRKVCVVAGEVALLRSLDACIKCGMDGMSCSCHPYHLSSLIQKTRSGGTPG